MATVVASRPEYGLAVVLALAPLTNLRVSGGAGLGKPMHLILPALVFGLLAYGALLGRGARGPAPYWLSSLLLVFLGVSIASSVQAIDPHRSTTKLFLLLTAIALFFAVNEICQNRAELTVVAVGAIAGLLLASLQGLQQHIFGHSGVAGFVVDGRFIARVQGSFGHPNQYGGYLAFLMPLAAAILVSKAFAPRVRWLAAVALAAAVPALAYSYARGAILALILGMLIWLAFLRPRYVLVVAGVVAIAAIFLAPPALKERFKPQSASGDVPLRTDIWGAAIDIYSTHPLLGVGVNNFPEAYEQLPSTLANASQRRLLNQSGLLVPPHAQNLYLNVLAEEGIIGLAALGALLLGALGVFYRGCRLDDPVARVIAIGGGAGLLTVAFHGVLEVTFLSELSLPLFALLAVTSRFDVLERTTA